MFRVMRHVAAPARKRSAIARSLDSAVYEVMKPTALDRAPRLSSKLGAHVLLKREDTTHVFSFKLRGAYNKFAKLTPAQKASGVACCSAGNHAQGVALASAKLGVPAKIFMPLTTPGIKVEAVRRFLGPDADLRVIADAAIVDGKLNDMPSGGPDVAAARARSEDSEREPKKPVSQVVLTGKSFDEAHNAYTHCIKTDGLTPVPPFNDDDVIDGQSTCALELLQQAKDMNVVFIPIGGGGLAAGVARVLKEARPEILTIGVEAADAAGMTTSLNAGKVVSLRTCGLFADGAAVRTVGDKTFDICSECLDATVTVTTDQICGAIKEAFGDTRGVLEPAGALGLAGVLKVLRKCGRTSKLAASGPNSSVRDVQSGPERQQTPLALADACFAWVKNEKTMARFCGACSEAACGEQSNVALGHGYDWAEHFPPLSDMSLIAMCTGANIDFNRLRFVSEFADHRESLVSVVLPEQQGSFYRLYAAIYPRSVTELAYRMSEGTGGSAYVIVSFHAFGAEDKEEVLADLETEGFKPSDLSSNTLAKVHGRHLAGGRSAAKGEQVIRFEFPERPGALKDFLDALESDPARPNVSMCHYRSHGHDTASVLIGIQVSEQSARSFAEHVGYAYKFETSNSFYSQFLRVKE